MLREWKNDKKRPMKKHGKKKSNAVSICKPLKFRSE